MIVENLWREFEQERIPADATADQRRTARECFFEGASSLFHFLATAASGSATPTAGDTAKMESIFRELQAFMQETEAASATLN